MVIVWNDTDHLASVLGLLIRNGLEFVTMLRPKQRPESAHGRERCLAWQSFSKPP
jgi:hypothetical protein